MSPAASRTAARPAAGNSILVVLILLTVMLLGSLALARISEAGSQAGGNVSSGDAALQAAEVGLNSGFAAVRALATEDGNQGGWYWATTQTADSAGIPGVAWDGTPELAVGFYRVRYAVERLCSASPVTDTLSQCLIQQSVQTESNREGVELPDPPNSRQFRVTVRITGPKDTLAWTQAMVTKGDAP